MVITLPTEVLSRYRCFSLYNSPYVAHERGHAIDLYPDLGLGPASNGHSDAPSPVAGTVLDTKAVRAPPKPYAAESDYLLLVDTGEVVARILHVEPTVEPGDTLAIGDPIGELVRAGFFAPWVGNHVHLEFREPEANPYRASGSLALELGVDIEGLGWDGSGQVVETGDTYAVLDSPAHPAPGKRFVGIASEEGPVLDGGLVHYTGGGSHVSGTDDYGETVSLLGQRVGHATGRDVTWEDIEVLANGSPITGLSLFCAREDFGAKLVCPGHEFTCSEHIDVEIRPSDDPIRLG